MAPSPAEAAAAAAQIAAQLKKQAEAERELEIARKAAKETGLGLIRDRQQLLDLMAQTTQRTEAEIKVIERAIAAELRLADAKQEDAASTLKLEQANEKFGEAMKSATDFAGLLHDKIRGVMGMQAGWEKDTIGIFAAAASTGKKMIDVIDEMGNKKETAKEKEARWASHSMKANEMVNASFYAIVSQMMKLGSAIDNASVSFKRSTGAADEFVRAIPQMEEKFYKLGLSAEDAAGVMGSLYSSMTGFTRLGPQAQKEIRETAAVLETLGIDAATSAKNMEILNRSLGYSGQQAANITGQLFGLAQQLNISTTQMMEDFTRLGPQLTVYGKQAVNVFVQLQASAKASGIAIERLLSIASKFDTFKGAADAVGFLNAQLGGPYLSVMKMVQQTDPTERMKMLAQATRQAGLSFDTMAYYQKKALAAAMGPQDVNELALVMKSRFDLVGGSVKMNSNEIERLAEENKKYKTVQQELQQVMRSLAGPVTSVLKGMRGFLQVMQENSGIVKFFASVIIGLKTAIISLKFAALAADVGMKTLAAGMLPMAPIIGLVVGAASLLAFTLFTEQHSPPLFGKNSGMSIAASQTAQFGSSLGYAAKQASAMAAPIRQLSTDINALPDSKMLRIEKVFEAEEGVLDASKGANITAHTVRLLGAAAGGSASGRPIQVHSDVTLNMDGKVVAHQVARQLSDKRS